MSAYLVLSGIEGQQGKRNLGRRGRRGQRVVCGNSYLVTKMVLLLHV